MSDMHTPQGRNLNTAYPHFATERDMHEHIRNRRGTR